ncbi:hypothetical protein [Bradyrhizobium liaoningense]
MTRYVIQIEGDNVPESLVGAPLSIEVISTDGRAQRTVLPLTSRPVRHEVSGPDSYLVRAALPSGRRLATTVVESGFIELHQDDMAIAKAVLDLEESGAAADFWREAGSLLQIAAAIRAANKPEEPLPRWLVEATRDLVVRTWKSVAGFVSDTLDHYRDKGAPVVVGGSTTEVIARPSVNTRSESKGVGGVPTPAATLNFEWGVFRAWEGEDGTAQRLLIQRGGTGSIGELGEVEPFKLENHRGNYLIRVLGPPPDPGSLVAWVPGLQHGSARIAIDPDNANNRSGSLLIAFPDLEDTMATTLFSYVRQSSLEEARIGLPVLVESLQHNTEPLGPNRGMLSAYVLYKLRHPYAAEFIPYLRRQFPELADVHILSAAQLIAAGRNGEVDEPLSKALDCGVPTYNEGIRLLRDSTNFLCDFYPQEPRFRSNARRASVMAAAANFDSSLTCLRLSDSLTAAFAGAFRLPAFGGSRLRAR